LRKSLIALMLTAAVAASSGLALAHEPLGVGAASESGAIAANDYLELEAHTVDAGISSGAFVVIEASATNTGTQPLVYWLPTPCHTPFKVTLSLEDGTTIGPLVRESELGQGPKVCPQVLKQVIMEPSQTMVERLAWDPGDAVITGTFDVKVSFAGRTSTGDGPKLEVAFPLTVKYVGDTDTHWAAETIREAKRAGIVAGYPDGSFRPEAWVSRAELIKMLVKSRQLTAFAREQPSFQDVATHWVESQGWLEPAVEAQMLYPADYAGRLAPDVAINRQEAAVMVVRALGLERVALTYAPEQVPFADKGMLPRWAAGYIAAAVKADVVHGYEDGTFGPDRMVTRAEAVTLVMRLLKNTAVEVDLSGSLEVNGKAVPSPGLLVRPAAPHLGFVALPTLAAAAGIDVAALPDGWVRLSRGSRAGEVRIKPGVPYGLTSHGSKFALDEGAPVMVQGTVYVSDSVLFPLGLTGRYDAASRTFRVGLTQ